MSICMLDIKPNLRQQQKVVIGLFIVNGQGTEEIRSRVDLAHLWAQ